MSATRWLVLGWLAGGLVGCEAEVPVEATRDAEAVTVATTTTSATATATSPEAPPPKTTEAQVALRARLLGLKPQNDDEPPPEEPSSEASDNEAPPRRVRPPPPPPPEDFPPEPAGPTGISDGAFQGVINEWRGVQQCLSEKAGRFVERTGAIRMGFEIQPDGSVASTEVLETTTMVAKAIAPCVAKKARRLTFPAFTGKPVVKEAKFVF